MAGGTKYGSTDTTEDAVVTEKPDAGDPDVGCERRAVAGTPRSPTAATMAGASAVIVTCAKAQNSRQEVAAGSRRMRALQTLIAWNSSTALARAALTSRVSNPAWRTIQKALAARPSS